jgi:single-strand DNA-binding protein
MSGVNKVILLGNLGRDPEQKATQGGLTIVRFSVATAERRKDQSGNWVDHTEWHNVVVFGRVAENCQRFLKKGSKVFIEGKLRTSKWQDKTDGRDRYSTEVIADNVQFIGGGAGARSGEGSDIDYSQMMPNDSVLAGIPTADSLPRVANGGSSAPISDEPAGFNDDDIPF